MEKVELNRDEAMLFTNYLASEMYRLRTWLQDTKQRYVELSNAYYETQHEPTRERMEDAYNTIEEYRKTLSKHAQIRARLESFIYGVEVEPNSYFFNELDYTNMEEEQDA